MSEQNMQTSCRNKACGKPLENLWGHCPHCGTSQKNLQSEELPPVSTITGTILCPHCHSSEVRKASALYSAGTWQGRSLSATHGVIYNPGGGQTYVDGLSSGISQGQTHLAARLQPPVPPRRNTYSPGLRIFYGILLGLLWSYAIIAATTCLFLISSGLVTIWTGDAGRAIIASLIGYWITKNYIHWQQDGQNTALHEAREAAYEAALSQWSRLYYCFQCDNVFAPAL